MYLTHFGLTGYPFERDSLPDELFASTSLRESQARLSHLVELRGIGLITGEVGSGKTTACRQFAASLHAQPVPLALCDAVHRQRDGQVQVHRLGPGPAHRA
jgi:type II secretory pathway predicted ATPase ExeA